MIQITMSASFFKSTCGVSARHQGPHTTKHREQASGVDGARAGVGDWVHFVCDGRRVAKQGIEGCGYLLIVYKMFYRKW